MDPTETGNMRRLFPVRVKSDWSGKSGKFPQNTGEIRNLITGCQDPI